MVGKRKRTSNVVSAHPQTAYPTSSSVAHTQVCRLRIVDMPAELVSEILSYVLPQGKEISIDHESYTPQQRRAERELARLSGQTIKRRNLTKGPTAVLRSCVYLRQCGVQALWSGNVFVFNTMTDIETFVKTTKQNVVESIRNVVVGESYHWNAPHIHPDWPPNLQILSAFTKLRTLVLYVGDLRKADLARLSMPIPAAPHPPIGPKYELWAMSQDIQSSRLSMSYVPREVFPALWLPKRYLDIISTVQGYSEPPKQSILVDDDGYGSAAPRIASDHLLLTLPMAVLGRLKRLTIKHLQSAQPIDYLLTARQRGQVWREWDEYWWEEKSGLAHAKHLHGLGSWVDCELCGSAGSFSNDDGMDIT